MGQRIAAVEGIRGLAILAIVAFHGWAASGRPAMPLLGIDLAPLFALGDHGTSVFFVLSGFCLMLPVVRAGRVPGYREFLARRGWRIVPPYYVALLFWLAFWVLYPHGPAESVDWVRRWPLHLGAHALFIHTLLPPTFFSLCPSLWFVGTLAQLYLLFPLLARPMARLPWLTFLVLLPNLLWRWHPGPAERLWCLPVFAAGMVAATVYVNLEGRRAPGWLRGPLEARALRAIGAMSYSLLLYNFIGILLESEFLRGVPVGGGVWWVLTTAALFAVSGIAYLAVERPIRLWRGRPAAVPSSVGAP